MLDVDVEVLRREFAVVAALSVAPGERLAILGPSGAGKTTVLEAIAGLVPVRRGTVRLGERVLTRTSPPAVRVAVADRRVGMLRQGARLFPHLTVEENLRYARRRPRVIPAGEAPDPIPALVEQLRLQGLLGARPAALSGGQAQRAALARVLASDHEALLLDEPLTGQDRALRLDLGVALAELLTQRPVPAILVSHDLHEAQAFGERLAVIDGGELLQVGPPSQVVRRPATPRVAELVGYAGVLDADRCGLADRSGPVPARWVAVHPDRVVLGPQPGPSPGFAARVVGLHPSGTGWTARVRLDTGERLRVRLAEPPTVGDRVTLTLVDPPVFDGEGRLLTSDPRLHPARAGG